MAEHSLETMSTNYSRFVFILLWSLLWVWSPMRERRREDKEKTEKKTENYELIISVMYLFVVYDYCVI